MHDQKVALVVIVCALFTLPLFAQTGDPADTAVVDTLSYPTPQPSSKIEIKDVPNDAGTALDISWALSPDDSAIVTKYQVLRSASADGPFEKIGETTKGQSRFTDNNTPEGDLFFYKIVALNEVKIDDQPVAVKASESAVFGPVKPIAQWFNTDRLYILIFLLIICGAIVYFISQAKAGRTLYIRKIAGIEAVDEAIGRATEMGRKIYYVPGIQDMDNMQTLAAIPILGRVAEIAARNDTYLEVPVSKSLVMVTAREAVRDAYGRAGRPDAFREDQVHYLTDDQFGYAAAIDGMVVREKPATIFYMGAFFAESLILSETGNAAGAIQIAGTAEPAQLPFFVAACDYTLIGEELFAASAYLSHEPKLLGSLKGQDVGKGLFLIAIILGIVLELLGVDFLQILQVR